MKKIFTVTLFSLAFLLIFQSKTFAHELFIQVKENKESNEYQVDVLWGHLRDFLDRANYEDYELYVRTPSGEVEQLSLEGIGVQARAFISPTEEGLYTLWAIRKPGTYSPSEDLTILSKQMAKAMFFTGDGLETNHEQTNLLVEIVPNTTLKDLKNDEFSGTVYYEGEVAPNIHVSAYGPADEVFETTTNEDGVFNLHFTSVGEWLIKASYSTEEDGALGEDEYSQVNRTSTLIINTESIKELEKEPVSQTDSANSLVYSMLILIGLLIGSAITLFVSKKRKVQNNE